MPFQDLIAANRRIAIVHPFTAQGGIHTLQGGTDEFFKKVKPQIACEVESLDYRAGDASYRFNHVKLIPPGRQAAVAQPVELQRDHPLFDLIGSNLSDNKKENVQENLVKAGALVAKKLVHSLDILASQRHSDFLAPLVLLAHFYALSSQDNILKDGNKMVLDYWKGIFASHPAMERAIFARLTCSADNTYDRIKDLEEAFGKSTPAEILQEDAKSSYAKGISDFRKLLEDKQEDIFIKKLAEDSNYKYLFKIHRKFKGNETISISGNEKESLADRYINYMRAKKIVTGFIKQPVNSALIAYWFFMHRIENFTVENLKTILKDWINENQDRVICSLSGNVTNYVRAELKKRPRDFNKVKAKLTEEGCKQFEINSVIALLDETAVSLRDNLVMILFDATQTIHKDVFIEELAKVFLSSTALVNEYIIKIKADITENYSGEIKKIDESIRKIYVKIGSNKLLYKDLKKELEKELSEDNAKPFVAKLEEQLKLKNEISVSELALAWGNAATDVILDAINEAGKDASGELKKAAVSTDSNYRWQLKTSEESHIGGYGVLLPDQFGSHHCEKRMTALYEEFKKALQGHDKQMELMVSQQDAKNLDDLTISLEGEKTKSITVSRKDEKASEASTKLDEKSMDKLQLTGKEAIFTNAQSQNNLLPDSFKEHSEQKSENSGGDARHDSQTPEDNQSQKSELVKMIVEGDIEIVYESGIFKTTKNGGEITTDYVVEKIRDRATDEPVGQLDPKRTEEVKKSQEVHLTNLNKLADENIKKDTEESSKQWRKLSRAVLFGEEIVAEQGPYGLGKQDFSALLGLCWGLVKDCLNDDGEISDEDWKAFNWTQYLKIPTEELARNDWIACLETWLRVQMIGSISNAELYLALVKTLDGLTKEATGCEIVVYDGFIRDEKSVNKFIKEIGENPVLIIAHFDDQFASNKSIFSRIEAIKKDKLTSDDYRKMRLPIGYQLVDVGWPINQEQVWPQAVTHEKLKDLEKNDIVLDRILEDRTKLVPLLALVSSGDFGICTHQNSDNADASWYPGNFIVKQGSFGNYLRLCWSRVPDLVALVVLSTFVEFISRARGRNENRQTYGQIAAGLQNDFLNHLPSAIRNSISSVTFHFDDQKLDDQKLDDQKPLKDFFTQIQHIVSLNQLAKLTLKYHSKGHLEIPIKGNLKEALKNACAFYEL